MSKEEDTRDSHASRENAIVFTKLFTKEENYTTSNACEFNRLWSEANRATQEMRAIINEMLLHQGIPSKQMIASKDDLFLVEKTRMGTRIITFLREIPKIIVRKYITN